MLLIRMISALPLLAVYALSEVMAFLFYYVLRYRRSVVRKNLMGSFPNKSKREIGKIERKFYRNFTRVFLEIMKSYSFKPDDWSKYVTIRNPEMATKYLKEGIPVILMAGHTANWEWAAFAIGRITGYSFDFLYKPLTNKSIDALMIKLRERHGGVAIPKENAIRDMIRKKKETRFIGMVADQLPSFGTEKVWSQFLNRETAFYVGAEKIATMMNYPVLYVDFRRIASGTYVLEFKKISNPPYEKGINYNIIERFVKMLEETIKANPSDYLWSHKRWKYTKEEEESSLSKN